MTGKPEDLNAKDGSDAAGGEPEAAPSAEAGAEETDEVSKLRAEAAELRDRALRTMADMENLRRRTEREIADAKQYAVANFARDMLSVSDNLQRALSAISEEDRTNADATLKSLLEGVEMTERDMLKMLDKHGVKRIDPKGEKFDPNFHQAMFEIPNPDAAHGSVIEVVQSGYLIGERVLRPALVGVAKGGPKPEQTSEAAGEAAPEGNASAASDPEMPEAGASAPGKTVDRSV
ncbi:MAG: nucleotide exchange factor GrpE [Hyphomicrobiales bacterium]|nr:nucleotide exchange factor GrpE [Hyphomicrobiales bacterium]